jgi:hypothetical protein
MKSPLHLLRKLYSAASAIGFLLLGWGCVSDGGGSDTETFAPLVLRADGSPAADAEVKLVPADYNPSDSAPERILTVRTDVQGRFRIPEPPAGNYNLLATAAAGAHGSSDEAGFAQGVAAGDLPDTLRLARARVLFISVHGDTYAAADSGKAWFPGTDLFVRCDGTGVSVLEGVPRTLGSMVIESRAGWRHEFELTTPGDSLVIWATRERVYSDPY